jgi:5'-3' exoribonuclease 1
MNEGGKIALNRLQVVLDEMQLWEQEIFEKEYADLNWYKGKQDKHVKEMEVARKKAGTGGVFICQLIEMYANAIVLVAVLTPPQKEIFEKVQAFVLQYRGASPTAMRNAVLTMPNTFPARERAFINKLADDLHLSLTWDEYDQEDQNLVTWRMPGALDEPLPEENNENGADGDDDAWEDADDDDEKEAREAVDRVLKKYKKAPVMDEGGEEDFERRHEASLKAKMDDWKKGYYEVGTYASNIL